MGRTLKVCFNRETMKYFLSILLYSLAIAQPKQVVDLPWHEFNFTLRQATVVYLERWKDAMPETTLQLPLKSKIYFTPELNEYELCFDSVYGRGDMRLARFTVSRSSNNPLNWFHYVFDFNDSLIASIPDTMLRRSRWISYRRAEVPDRLHSLQELKIEEPTIRVSIYLIKILGDPTLRLGQRAVLAISRYRRVPIEVQALVDDTTTYRYGYNYIPQSPVMMPAKLFEHVR
jgi:hypothetical protein